MIDSQSIRLRLIEAAAKTPAATHSSSELIADHVTHVAERWLKWVEQASKESVVQSPARSSVADKSKGPA